MPSSHMLGTEEAKRFDLLMFQLELALVGSLMVSVARFAADLCCRRILVGDNKANLLKDLLLRHDCRKIGAELAAVGFECSVLQREEVVAPPTALGNSAA